MRAAKPGSPNPNTQDPVTLAGLVAVAYLDFHADSTVPSAKSELAAWRRRDLDVEGVRPGFHLDEVLDVGVAGVLLPSEAVCR